MSATRLESSRGYASSVLKGIGVDFFPSLATVKTRTASQSGSGQKVFTYSSLTDHVDVPCRLAPYIKERPVSGEERRAPGTFVSETLHCLLFGYYPGVLKEMKVDVDGVEYGILAVEHDGGKVLTRLRVESVRP